MNDPSMQGSPAYVPSPIMSNQAQPAMPRKVLINPNFKGGVEAAKSKRKFNFILSSSLTLKLLFFRSTNEGSIFLVGIGTARGRVVA